MCCFVMVEGSHEVEGPDSDSLQCEITAFLQLIFMFYLNVFMTKTTI